jgi:hypothetical protein
MKRGTRDVIRDLDRMVNPSRASASTQLNNESLELRSRDRESLAGSRAAMRAHDLRRALDISHADAGDAANFVTTHPE